MQGISVKFLGPTDFRPSRYKAEAEAGSLTLATDYSLDAEGNATRAAKALVEKLKWDYGRWIGASLGNDVWAFVCDSSVSPSFKL